MVRLSKKGWNNVLIFTMLIMITVLNMDKFSGTSESGTQSILQDGEIVLSMQVDQNVIERVGRSWRISDQSPAYADNISAERLAVLVNNWERAVVDTVVSNANGMAVDNDIFKQANHVVVIWVAGQTDGQVYPIARRGDDVYIGVNNQVMLLKFPKLSQLVSW